MQTMIILGAGQFGRAFAALLNTSEYKLLAFGDNNPKLHGTFIRQIPVVSIPQAVSLEPDCLLIGVIDQKRSAELYRQAFSIGFRGEFFRLSQLYQLLDIRSATLCRLAQRLKQQEIPGSIAELGVYKGDLAVKLNALFPECPLHLFDTFEGFDHRDIQKEETGGYSNAREGDFSDTSEQAVRDRLPYPEKAVFHKGYFPGTAKGLEEELYALVSIDADLYAPILAGLTYFYPRLARGGAILLHDYNNGRFKGAGQAVTDYEKEHGPLLLTPLCDLHGSAVILKP